MGGARLAPRDRESLTVSHQPAAAALCNLFFPPISGGGQFARRSGLLSYLHPPPAPRAKCRPGTRVFLSAVRCCCCWCEVWSRIGCCCCFCCWCCCLSYCCLNYCCLSYCCWHYYFSATAWEALVVFFSCGAGAPGWAWFRLFLSWHGRASGELVEKKWTCCPNDGRSAPTRTTLPPVTRCHVPPQNGSFLLETDSWVLDPPRLDG